MFSPIIIVSREEVNSKDTISVLKALHALVASPEGALRYFESVDIAFHGYNDWNEELFEIQVVRECVYALDEEFPYWLFFLDKSALGLQCIAHCFLPPFLTDEAKKEIFLERLNDLLTRRWFPAMNQVCDAAGFSEEQIEALSERSVRYLLGGPISD
ncbi:MULTISPECIES: hypothetical protein [unclassified Thiocapsa]|uniref:hypothetical protein n=1 Tax=unclassified Thiocapsa TaxID=2641286 RepID=UPI0035B46F14